MTPGYFAAFFTVCCWTAGTFVFTQASRLESPATVNRIRLVLAWIWLSLLVIISQGFLPQHLFSFPSVEQYLWFGLSGIVGLSIGDHFSFTAFKILGSRRATIFNCFAPAAALLAGMLMLDEMLSVMGLVGMAIAIGGVMLLSLSRHEKAQVQQEGHGSFSTGIFAGFMSAVCQGVGLVLAKKGFVQTSDFVITAIHATWIRMLMAALSIYAFSVFTTPVVKEFVSVLKKPTHLKPIVLGSIFGPTLGVSSSLYAASVLNVSVAQTIFALVPVVVLMVSFLFYREKLRLISVLAALVSIAGVLVLVWQDTLYRMLFTS